MKFSSIAVIPGSFLVTLNLKKMELFGLPWLKVLLMPMLEKRLLDGGVRSPRTNFSKLVFQCYEKMFRKVRRLQTNLYHSGFL